MGMWAWLFVASCVVCARAAVPASEKAALLDLYNNLGGSTTWIDTTNWKSGDPCEQSWHGITCSADKKTVTGVDLSSNGLTGSLPDSLGALTNVTELVLGSNHLTGKFPASFAQMTKMYAMSIRGGDNMLGGSLELFSNMADLQFAHLDFSAFTGSLDSFANARSLKVLGLTNNQVSGTLPASLLRLPKLQTLLLGGNSELSGTFPELSDDSSITSLDLSNTKISGQLPASISHLTALQELDLFRTQLSGPLPANWSALVSLCILDLHNNAITGAVPASLASLANLTVLHLQNNNLTGTYPAALQNLPALDVSGNPGLTPVAAAASSPGPQAAPVPRLALGGPSVGANATRVRLAVYGMQKCPDMTSLEIHVLAPLMQQLGPIVDLSLDFMADFNRTDDYVTHHWSLHGQGEAIGDTAVLCVNKYFGVQTALDFAVCLAKSPSAVPLNIPSCLKQQPALSSSATQKQLMNCTYSDEGFYGLLRPSARASKQARVTWSPTAIINGSVFCLWDFQPCPAQIMLDADNYNYPASLSNFVAKVCQTYPGADKPAACSWSAATSAHAASLWLMASLLALWRWSMNLTR